MTSSKKAGKETLWESGIEVAMFLVYVTGYETRMIARRNSRFGQGVYDITEICNIEETTVSEIPTLAPACKEIRLWES
jgi:hypothetical protein